LAISAGKESRLTSQTVSEKKSKNWFWFGGILINHDEGAGDSPFGMLAGDLFEEII
jgi:hypothetical protein